MSFLFSVSQRLAFTGDDFKQFNELIVTKTFVSLVSVAFRGRGLAHNSLTINPAYDLTV